MGTIRAMKIEPNKPITIIDVKNKLIALQLQVGGYIETVPLGEDSVMIVDEEGMMKQYPHNDLASYISERHIYGTALIVGMDLSGHFFDVPEQYYVWLGN